MYYKKNIIIVKLRIWCILYQQLFLVFYEMLKRFIRYRCAQTTRGAVARAAVNSVIGDAAACCANYLDPRGYIVNVAR